MQGLRDCVVEKGLILVLGVFGCLRGQASLVYVSWICNDLTA